MEAQRRQRVSLVGYTGGESGSPRLWNLQNLHAVPPYALSRSMWSFKCVDALGEYMSEYRLKIQASLRYAVQNFPGTQMFLTRRQIQDEAEEYLTENAVTVPAIPR